MPDRIRIDDLRSPVLNDVQREALARAERSPVTLTVDTVLGEAVAATGGLSDFGPEDFRERLQIWLTDIEADSDMTAFGRAAVFRTCVRFATTRLLVEDLLHRHPEIHDVEVVAPLVVIGLPRSGTTHLVNLLAADRRRRSLPFWEACEPVPHPADRTSRNGDGRRARSQLQWEALQKVLPYMALMHPMDPDHVHEELELQGPDFSMYQIEWFGYTPRWRDYYLSHDQTPHYQYLKTMLKLLQWQRGPSRWVLKCPQHFEQIVPLMNVFPDATVVMTHRDPVAVVQSAATMVSYSGRMRYKNVDVDRLFSYWSQRIERLLAAAVRDIDVIPVGQRIDVPFEVLTGDEMGVLERIYDQFGLDMNREAEAQLREYGATHRRGRDGQIVYDLRQDFGVDPDDLRQQFKFYFDAFPVRAEG